MKQSDFTIESNRPLTQNVYEMRLSGDTTDITAPGQFVNIHIDGLYLRRPISVCDVESSVLTLIYKVVGQGTARMAGMKKGECLDLLTGLGNGYDLTKCGEAPLLIGGGAGVPPMYYLAKCLLREGRKVSAILGFNTAQEVFYEAAFRELGAQTFVATADGSRGIRGFVTDALREVPAYSSICACGPEPMLKAVYFAADCPGQFSFEERMGCGFGACMGCTCKTLYGNKRICRDGPVLDREEILWPTHA